MAPRVFAAGLLALAASAAAEPPLPERIESETTVRKDRYARPAADGAAAVVVRGEGFTVDFAGATLAGADVSKDPADRYTGIGVLLDACKKVTLKNAHVQGYRIGILARNCEEIRIESCGVSWNRRARLKSTPEKLEGEDWLDGQDPARWRDEYGAGILLEESRRAAVWGARGGTSRTACC